MFAIAAARRLLVVALVTVNAVSAWHVRARAAESFTMRGTIDLRTFAAHGPARIPSGAVVQIYVLSNDRYGTAYVGGLQQRIAVAGTSLPYSLTLANGYGTDLVALVRSPGCRAARGAWLLRLAPVQPLMPRITDAAASGVVHVDLSARGAALPANMPRTPIALPEYGTLEGDIATRSHDGASITPDHIEVLAERSDTHAPVGLMKLTGGLAATSAGGPTVHFCLTGLPYDVALTISARVRAAAGASPLPTGFAHLLQFGARYRPLGGAYEARVTRSAPDTTGTPLDFDLIDLEVPPLPMPPSTLASPGPAATASP